MRDILIERLFKYAQNDEKIVLVTGDLGFGVLNSFYNDLPDQFINAGVAEQAMAGISAGLASEGKIVFIYSIGNFPSLRCLEQIRNDICYHNYPVTIISVGAGFSYGALGMSHHATEDISILRSLPNIRIFAPSDKLETIASLEFILDNPAPSYIRLDKSMVEDVTTESFEYMAPRKLSGGESGVAILSYGGLVKRALEASEILTDKGIDCTVYSVATIKPINEKIICEILKKYSIVVTFEEHILIGGLGSMIADILTKYDIRGCRLLKIGLPDEYSTIVGDQNYLRDYFKLRAVDVVQKILSATL